MAPISVLQMTQPQQGGCSGSPMEIWASEQYCKAALEVLEESHSSTVQTNLVQSMLGMS